MCKKKKSFISAILSTNFKCFFRCGAKILLLISTVLGGQLPKCCRLGEVTINISLIIIDHHFHRHHHHLLHLQFNKKTKSPFSKLHLLNVKRHSFCDPIEKNEHIIKLELLATGPGERGLCLSGSRRKANEGLVPEQKSDFWSKSPLKQLLSRAAQCEPQCLPPQRLSILFDVLLTCVASRSFLIWRFFHRFHRSG